MRERARVRGRVPDYATPSFPHPAFGHLLPEGEGTGSSIALIVIHYIPADQKNWRPGDIFPGLLLFQISASPVIEIWRCTMT
jgi:hypothetical protein